MKKYAYLIFFLFFLSSSHQALADQIDQKTDGSFVGDNPPKPINSSFIGDTSDNSITNDSFVGQDTQKDTDGDFVGSGTIQSENSAFSGDSYQQQVGTSTVAPFAGDNSQTSKYGN